MAWPPPALPTNRTNTTVQFDTHKDDHNLVNAAMNDTTAEITDINAAVKRDATQVTLIPPGGGPTGHVRFRPYTASVAHGRLSLATNDDQPADGGGEVNSVFLTRYEADTALPFPMAPGGWNLFTGSNYPIGGGNNQDATRYMVRASMEVSWSGVGTGGLHVSLGLQLGNSPSWSGTDPERERSFVATRPSGTHGVDVMLNMSDFGSATIYPKLLWRVLASDGGTIQCVAAEMVVEQYGVGYNRPGWVPFTP